MNDESEATAEFVTIAPEPSRGVFSFSVLGTSIATGLIATGSALWLEPPLSWGLAVGVSLVGGVTAGVLAGVPRRQGEAALLRERAAREEERKTWGAAVVDLESLRRQINLATLALRGRKDPLVEVPELRVGALHDLLEASRDVGVAGPVVSRIAVDEAELVGDAGRIPGFLDSASLAAFDAPDTAHAHHAHHAPHAPEVHAAPVAPAPGFDPRIRREALEAVDGLIQALEHLGEEIENSADTGQAPAASSGSPAQLVDTVVQTAANGIEDLAAGLMRANELATVAEKVTNRATLLALNAALEATRTGGEAMGAIAEETRRLAEYAREATDTISRLAGEIEVKVGETITAIHATSEDAKAGLATLSTGAAPSATNPERALEAIVGVLDRAYNLRAKLAGEENESRDQDLPIPAAGGGATPRREEPRREAEARQEKDSGTMEDWAAMAESLTPEQAALLERLQAQNNPERRS